MRQTLLAPILKCWLQCHLPSGSFPTFAREFPDLLGKTDVLGLESEDSVVYTLKPSKNRLVLVFCSTSSKKVWSLEMKSQIRNTEQSQWCGCTKFDLSGQIFRLIEPATITHTDFPQIFYCFPHDTRRGFWTYLKMLSSQAAFFGINVCTNSSKCINNVNFSRNVLRRKVISLAVGIWIQYALQENSFEVLPTEYRSPTNLVETVAKSSWSGYPHFLLNFLIILGYWSNSCILFVLLCSRWIGAHGKKKVAG